MSERKLLYLIRKKLNFISLFQALIIAEMNIKAALKYLRFKIITELRVSVCQKIIFPLF